MPGDALVFVTIGAAVVAWALAELLQSRWLWAAGAALTLIHSAAAFDLFYDWSHEAAREATLRQTAALTGLTFSGGIYVNYAFLVIWTWDALWWLLRRDSYLRRSPRLTLAIRGFIFFIIVNGAVIFADGWARVLGLGATSLVVFAWLRTRS